MCNVRTLIRHFIFIIKINVIILMYIILDYEIAEKYCRKSQDNN